MTLYLVCNCPDPPFPASGELDRASAGGRDDLRRVCSAAWAVDRPPALLSHAVENPRPYEPAFTRSAREVIQGRGAETQSNPRSVRWLWKKLLKQKVKYSLALT